MRKQKDIPPVDIYPSEKWYHERYGFDSVESEWTDPVKRTEREREKQRALYDDFCDVGMGDADPRPSPNIEAYGHRFVPALFGCGIKYAKDQPPSAMHLDGDPEKMGALEVPDFEKSGVVRRAREDAGLLYKKYGCCSGVINMGSPLNVAVNMYGEAFLIACALEPNTARHVLFVIAETQLKLYHELCAKIEPGVFPDPIENWNYGNCPAVMLSPEMYESVVLPVDLWFRDKTQNFTLHHCGVFDKYVDLYTRLCPDSLEIGGGSDYEAIKTAFPTQKYSLLMNTADIEKMEASEAVDYVADVMETCRPYDRIVNVVIAELSPAASNDMVRVLASVPDRLSV